MRSTFEERVFQKSRFSENVVFVFPTFSEGGFGCFRRDFCEFVRILAWNRDGK